jgi:hypothetical protein
MRATLLVASVGAVLGGFQPAGAQSSPQALVLQIAVRPSYVGRAGDTVSIAYTVVVSTGSTDSLANFVVDAPSRVNVIPPARILGWSPGNLYYGHRVASWGTASHEVAAGDSTPSLVMRAVGLPDVQRYWGEGGLQEWMRSMSRVMDDRDEKPDTTMRIVGPTGWTVSVSPMPSDLSSSALASRLNNLIGRACTLGWISNAATCAALSANAVANADQLRALLSDLNAQRGNQVNESAYVLLLDNVQFLLGRL